MSKVIGNQTATTEIAPLRANGGASEIPMECHAEFQVHFSIFYESALRPYSDFAPAYEYGYRMATQNPDHGLEDVEETLRADFILAHPNCDWEKMRRAIRYGWMRALQ